MGHYLSEMTSEKEREEENLRLEKDRKETIQAISDIINRDGLATLLLTIVESFEFPTSLKSRLKRISRNET